MKNNLNAKWIGQWQKFQYLNTEQQEALGPRRKKDKKQTNKQNSTTTEINNFLSVPKELFVNHQ